MFYDNFATAFKSQYELFMLALTGLYLQRVQAKAGTPVHELQAKALEIRNTFLATATHSINTYQSTVSDGSDMSAAGKFYKVVAEVTLHNVAQTVALAQAAQLNGFGSMSGGMGELVNKKFAGPELTVRVGNRTYQADGYIANTARHYAYTEALKAKVAEIAQTSDLAEVVYNDPAHDNNGLVFSISGKTQGYPSMESLARDVFHHNSSAWVTHV